MSRLQDTGEVKALFRMLVKAAGGVEAAGVELGVTHQRISQLQSPSNEEEPTYRQIRSLEVAIGRPIVTGAHVKAVTGDEAECITDAAVQAVACVSRALTLVHDMDADGSRDAGEIHRVRLATSDAKSAVSRLEAKAATLKPGEVG